MGRKNNVQYWNERALLKEERMKNQGDKLLSNLKKEYEEAQKDISDKLEKFYKTYSDEEGISIAQAKKKLNKKEQAKYQDDIEDFLEKAKSFDPKYEKELRYRYLKSRVSKLESIQNQVTIQQEILAKSQDIQTFKHLQKVYKDSYYAALSDANKTGIGVSFDKLDSKMVENICMTPWSGKSFSERIWGNNKKLIKETRNILSQGFITGLNVNTMSKKLSKRMDVAFHRARTLVRTETNHLLNQATLDSYEELGLDKYQFLATLDSRTSTVCQSLDNKVFNVKDQKVGVNYPPMHPNCRSTTVPYFEEDEEVEEERFARDKDEKGIYVSADTDYSKWSKKYMTKELNTLKLAGSIQSKYKNTATKEPEKTVQHIEDNEEIMIISDIDNVDTIKAITEELGQIPKEHKNILNETVKEIVVVEEGNSRYDRKNGIVYILKNPDKGEVIHELGHVLETKLRLDDNKKFKNILEELTKGKAYDDINLDADTFVQPIYTIKSDKLISQYQGRLYLGESGFINSRGAINIDALGEYFSEGYREYIQNPQNLKEKDVRLYEFIKEVIK